MSHRDQWPAWWWPGHKPSATTNSSARFQADWPRGDDDQVAINTLETTASRGCTPTNKPFPETFPAHGAGSQLPAKQLDWSKLSFGDMIDPRRGFIYETQDVPRGENVQRGFGAGLLASRTNSTRGRWTYLNEPNESLVIGVSRLPMKITGHAGAAAAAAQCHGCRSVDLSKHFYRMQGEF